MTRERASIFASDDAKAAHELNGASAELVRGIAEASRFPSREASVAGPLRDAWLGRRRARRPSPSRPPGSCSQPASSASAASGSEGGGEPRRADGGFPIRRGAAKFGRPPKTQSERAFNALRRIQPPTENPERARLHARRKIRSSRKSASSEEKASAFISGAGLPRSVPAPGAEQEAGKTTVNMQFDAALLRRIDRAAKSQGISRTAWLHVAASKALE